MATSISHSTVTARRFLAGDDAAQLHRAWDTTNSTYDPVQDKYVASSPKTIRTVAAGPTDNFIRVMEAFKKNYPNDAFIAKFNIRDSHSWDEVLLTAGMSQQSFKAKAKGFKGLFSRIGRQVGDANPAISPVLSTLPQGEYTSIVCGGIILIFNAFKRMSAVRDRVMNTLGDSPQILEQVEDFVRLYPDDHKLNESAIKLYIALLIAIEGMITWFDHGIKDRIKVFVMQDLYAKKLEDKIVFLETCTKNVRDQAEMCDKSKTVEIANKILEVEDQIRQFGTLNLAATQQVGNQVSGGFDEMKGEMGQTRKDIADDIEGISRKMSDRFGDMQTDMKDDFSDMSRSMNDSFENQKTDMKDGFAQMDVSLQTLKTQNDENFSRMEKAMVERLNALSALNSALSTNEKKLDWEAEAKRLKERAASLELRLEESKHALQLMRTTTLLQQGEILRLLGNIYQIGYSNIENYIRVARAIDSSPDLINAVMASSKVQLWVASPNSQMLLVDPPFQASKISPGTFVTATLGQALINMPPAITLVHFCRGEVTDGVRSNPATYLMACLVSQLLATRQWDLREWSEVTSTKDHYELLECRDLDYLCSFFKRLVRTLPYGRILCLVDDFFHLEHNTDADSLSTVIRTFTELVETTMIDQVVIFKIMIITPNRKGNVVRFIPKEDLLSLSMDDSIKSHGEYITSKQQKYYMEHARRKNPF